MKVIPQTVPTPRGHVLGWKCVRQDRIPIYRDGDRYAVGTTHIAQDDRHRDSWMFRSGRKLRRLRAKHLASLKGCRSSACLPGIHICKTSEAAEAWWSNWHHDIVIPVSYSPKSVAGKKDRYTIVVYRIKVLG